MKLVRNAGSDRVLDLVGAVATPGRRLDLMSAVVSVFGFEAVCVFQPIVDGISG